MSVEVEDCKILQRRARPKHAESTPARMLTGGTPLSSGCTSKTFTQMHVALPQDDKLVGKTELESLGGIDEIVGGWECQGYSRARHGLGLKNPRSRLLFELGSILNEV